MKLDHEEEPQLSEPYLSKQKKLMVSGSKIHSSLWWWGDMTHGPSTGSRCLMSLHGCKDPCPSIHPSILTPLSTQAKILEHDNVNYLKKILGELGMVLDQIEAELEKRKLEYQGRHWAAFMGCFSA